MKRLRGGERPAARVKPFLKWAGGKFRVLAEILPALPAGERYVEPFAGSAAVYLNVASVPAGRAVVCDLNPDLIALYRHVQREGAKFIGFCSTFFVPENNTPGAFLALRAEFNASTGLRRRAALLLYLNRHAYNGLVRYNAAGGYNVPFGKYKRPHFPEAEMRAFWQKTQDTPTEFMPTDFRSVFARLAPGDVVYCDPPYLPLSKTANFTAYAGSPFGPEEHAELARLARAAAGRGIPVLISNHDTPAARELYAGAEIRSFSVRRAISCRAEGRGGAPEILAIYR